MPSFSYCFSFEQKTDWSRKWAPQAEILAYMEHCAQRYGLGPHIRFGAEVTSSRFEERDGRWRVELANGERLEADVLVSGVGQLHRPHVPDIPGLARFEGPCFHSARWEPGLDLTGKRVALIGNAASAVQIVPEIARQTARLHVFQRSANWMLPRGDRAYSEEEKRRFSRYPWLAKLYRWLLWASLELRWPLFRGNRFLAKRVEAIALRHLNEVVGDPALRAALVPDYPLGGKRILVSDDYYETLTREDVELVTADIDHLNEDGVVTRDGANRPVDVVILATGFETTAFLAPMRLEGIGGHRAVRDWEDGARSFLGISSAGYPNFFMMYGPNTNLGHNSIIFMLECQAAYIVQCIRRLIDRDVAWLDVHPGVQAAYDADIQADLQRTVWAAPDRSWYKNAAGRITNNWAGSTLAYWWRTRTVDFSLYREVPRAELPPYRGAAPDSAAA